MGGCVWCTSSTKPRLMLNTKTFIIPWFTQWSRTKGNFGNRFWAVHIYARDYVHINYFRPLVFSMWFLEQQYHLGSVRKANFGVSIGKANSGVSIRNCGWGLAWSPRWSCNTPKTRLFPSLVHSAWDTSVPTLLTFSSWHLQWIC